MELNIITPDQAVYNGGATSVTVPGSAGSFEILKDHAPIISTLDDGDVIIRNNKETEVIRIKGGVVEVRNDKITVLAEGVITTK